MDCLSRFKEILNTEYPSKTVSGKIPSFSPRPHIDREYDVYDMNYEMVDRYTGLFAFAYKIFNYGGAESLYRTIASILLREVDCKEEKIILDVGCGVGRSLYDLAPIMPSSLFVGVDYSYNMTRRASQLLLDGKKVWLNFSDAGLGRVEMEGSSFDNVIIAQADAEKLPFKDNSVDALINTFMLDRVQHPDRALSEMSRVLKPGGIFILTDPLNHRSETSWEYFGTPDRVKSEVEKAGIKVEEWFDGLIFREMQDGRGNVREWKTLALWGRKLS